MLCINALIKNCDISFLIIKRNNKENLFDETRDCNGIKALLIWLIKENRSVYKRVYKKAYKKV